ncbi:hypothetical protein PVL29_019420 [Vitis rotundifolia]|uniref:Uncharacterized protein n=1 Tax=Vitis rotundifolia TaxID=103349 RepID=A0AA38Z101_VITRO|nr:hypothetical protein PVL29_019420 [Vitis rotundifolia]
MEDKWEKVVDMYNKYPNIQYTKLTVSKDTALHITVLESTKDIVSKRGWETRSPLWMPNDRGNMPLHVVALIGNVGKCMCIAEKHEELLGLSNNAVEMPLFLASLCGKKGSFHYLDRICKPGRHYEYLRGGTNSQTILRVAIIGQYYG